MRLIARIALVPVLMAGAVAVWLTLPRGLPIEVLRPRQASLSNGESMFNIGGCASCHATPRQTDRLRLGGGRALKTRFGTFMVPNISSDKRHGIGRWDELAFLNAMLRGVGESGEHLYPAFPYTSYQRMSINDVRDLFAFLRTVRADATPSQSHALTFPFNIRRAIGFWKLLFLDEKPFQPLQTRSSELNRGAYLVEGPGHCAECHSPRNWFGGIANDQRFSGGLSPSGDGYVPNITQHDDGLKNWSRADFELFLKEGLTPDGQSVDPEMAAVISNTARLPAADRAAMAAYLKSLPARPGKRAPRQRD